MSQVEWPEGQHLRGVGVIKAKPDSVDFNRANSNGPEPSGLPDTDGGNLDQVPLHRRRVDPMQCENAKEDFRDEPFPGAFEVHAPDLVRSYRSLGVRGRTFQGR